MQFMTSIAILRRQNTDWQKLYHSSKVKSDDFKALTLSVFFGVHSSDARIATAAIHRQLFLLVAHSLVALSLLNLKKARGTG